MVGDTCRAYAGGLVPPHQEPASLVPTEIRINDDEAAVRGAVLGVPGGWRRPYGTCRPHWLRNLRRLASHGSQVRPPPYCSCLSSLSWSLPADPRHPRNPRLIPFARPLASPKNRKNFPYPQKLI